MTTIAIAVLAILLAALIVKNTKAEIKDLGKEYVKFVKALFTRGTLTELTDDLKHVGATLVEAVRAFTKYTLPHELLLVGLFCV